MNNWTLAGVKQAIAGEGGATIGNLEEIEQADNMTAQASTPTEEEDQAFLFEWAAVNEGRYPELALMHHIPNGGHRLPAVAAKLKAQGVKPGIPDIFLPAPIFSLGGRVVSHGLYIELKRVDRSNHASDAQKQMMDRLRNHGYKVEVCYGFDEARIVIEEYLSHRRVKCS